MLLLLVLVILPVVLFIIDNQQLLAKNPKEPVVPAGNEIRFAVPVYSVYDMAE